MKKDYIYIDQAKTRLSQNELIEDFWTAIWDKNNQACLNSVSWINNNECYRIMEPYLNIIPSGGRVLDAGCGQGQWTVFLSSRGYEVYGIDVSKKTIEWLNTNFPEHHFLCADIRATDFKDEYFDLQFSWGVFEHFEDGPGACIHEAHRVLKTGGYLCITVPFFNLRHIIRDSRSIRNWDKLAYDPEKDYRTNPIRFYQWRFTMPELEFELATRGFSVLTLKPTSYLHGIKGALKFDFSAKSDSLKYRLLESMLRFLIPKQWISHMIIAVAQKV